jgi:subtilisin family serine protease
LTTTGPGGNWVSETVWNDGQCSADDCEGCSASSGGISTSYSIPSYQQGISMSANQGSTTMRNIPDVAMVGDNIAFVADNGEQETGVGTSFATPLWAGFIALVNQRATRLTVNPRWVFSTRPSTRSARGRTMHLLFTISPPAITPPQCSPDQFFAVAGYDLCTGWGTPNGGGLINALTCAYTIATSSAPSGGGSTGWRRHRELRVGRNRNRDAESVLYLRRLDGKRRLK